MNDGTLSSIRKKFLWAALSLTITQVSVAEPTEHGTSDAAGPEGPLDEADAYPNENEHGIEDEPHLDEASPDEAPSLETLEPNDEPIAVESAGSGVHSAEPPHVKLTPWALRRYTLRNGLRVVLHEDHATPSVAVCITYDVGSRDEGEGQSGFAHLFEHLMFQGSRQVEKGGHALALAGRGGRTNATTNKERTTFLDLLPASQLQLALWLEADRMGTLALGRDAFENQLRVVQEEYRQRYDNRAFAHGRLRLAQLVFQGDFAYEHPTIGSLEDLEASRLEWARDFHRRYYRPENAVLSVVGDFDTETAEAWIEEHFADLEPGGAPKRFEATPQPFSQASERFLVMVDEGAKTPALLTGWSIPAGRVMDRSALELATEVLAGGESGRLHQSLVIEKASALEVSAWTANERGPGLFAIEAVVAPLSNVDTVQKWLDGELKRLRFIGPSADELHRARARLEMRDLLTLETNEGRATRLGEYEVYFGDASLVQPDLERYRGITPEQVRKAAHTYLKDTRRSTVEVYPPGWARDLGPVITTTTYVVQKGDTLIGIAKKHGTSADAIARENRISKGRPIHPGQRLLVTLGSGSSAGPRAIVKKHVVKKGDTLSGIAMKYGTTAEAIARENRFSTKKPIRPGQELTITVEVSGPQGKAAPKATPPAKAPKATPPAKSAPKKAAPKAPLKKAPVKK
jgi:zinc protease